MSGEEHLYSDFPEIDLSQLDAGDLDSAGCFSELQWGGEHSETDSSQYSTDDSELFQVPPSPRGWRQGDKEDGRREHTPLLISPPQLISAPLICAPALNGASRVGLMRRRRRRLLSQPSCAGLLTGNCSASCSIPRIPGWQCGGLSAGKIPFPGAGSSPFPRISQLCVGLESLWQKGWLLSSALGWAGSMALPAPCKAGAGDAPGLLLVPLLWLCFISWSCEDRTGQGWGHREMQRAQSRLGSPLALPKALPCPGCACPWGWALCALLSSTQAFTPLSNEVVTHWYHLITDPGLHFGRRRISI